MQELEKSLLLFRIISLNFLGISLHPFQLGHPGCSCLTSLMQGTIENEHVDLVGGGRGDLGDRLMYVRCHV